MAKAKIAVTIDEKTLRRLDRLVAQKSFSNRSQAVEKALQEKIERMDRTRLAVESALLDPREEKALAEEAIQTDLTEWPQF